MEAVAVPSFSKKERTSSSCQLGQQDALLQSFKIRHHCVQVLCAERLIFNNAESHEHSKATSDPDFASGGIQLTSIVSALGRVCPGPGHVLMYTELGDVQCLLMDAPTDKIRVTRQLRMFVALCDADKIRVTRLILRLWSNVLQAKLVLPTEEGAINPGEEEVRSFFGKLDAASSWI